MVGDADGSAHLELRLSARIGLSGQQRRRRLQAGCGRSSFDPERPLWAKPVGRDLFAQWLAVRTNAVADGLGVQASELKGEACGATGSKVREPAAPAAYHPPEPSPWGRPSELGSRLVALPPTAAARTNAVPPWLEAPARQSRTTMKKRSSRHGIGCSHMAPRAA